jgi:hypothetical protein
MKIVVLLCVLAVFFNFTAFSQSRNNDIQGKIAEIKQLLWQLEHSYLNKLDHRQRHKANELLDRINRKLDALVESRKPPRKEKRKEPPRKEKHKEQIRMIPPNEFSGMMKKLKGMVNRDDKLFIISQNAKVYHFTIEQLIKIIRIFPFDKERLEAIHSVLPKITDTQNEYKLLDHVKFQSSKNKLKEMIKNTPRKRY